jgi:hypothetical protein
MTLNSIAIATVLRLTTLKSMIAQKQCNLQAMINAMNEEGDGSLTPLMKELKDTIDSMLEEKQLLEKLEQYFIKINAL